MTSKEACEIAATTLGLSGTSAYNIANEYANNFPYGCIYASNNNLFWNHKWNDVPVPCGTKYGSQAYDCLCKISGRISIFHF